MLSYQIYVHLENIITTIYTIDDFLAVWNYSRTRLYRTRDIKVNCKGFTSWCHMKELSKCWRTICVSLKSAKPFSSYEALKMGWGESSLKLENAVFRLLELPLLSKMTSSSNSNSRWKATCLHFYLNLVVRKLKLSTNMHIIKLSFKLAEKIETTVTTITIDKEQ